MKLNTPTIHPGKILKEQFILPLINQGQTLTEISTNSGISLKILLELMLEKQSITENLAELLSNYFGTNYHYWVNLQNDFDSKINFP